MSNSFIGEIRMLGFPFAPLNWALCQGQILLITQFTALFALIGITYGGDGRTTFSLPDLQGRMAIGAGSSATGGLQNANWGQTGGSPTTVQSVSSMPAHTHAATFTPSGKDTPTVRVSTDAGKAYAPSPAYPYLSGSPNTTSGAMMWIDNLDNAMSLGGVSSSDSGGTVTVAPAGEGQPMNIMNPYLTLNFSIALQGLFPQRN